MFWLEKMKGQALLEALRKRNLISDFSPDPTLKELDLKLEKSMEKEIDWERYQQLRLEKENLYTKYGKDPIVKPYVKMRNSEIIKWAELKHLIQEDDAQILIIGYYMQDSHVAVFGMRAEWENPKFLRVSLTRKTIEAIKTKYQQGLKAFSQLLWKRNTDDSRGFYYNKKDILQPSSGFFDNDFQNLAELTQPIQNWSKPGDIICIVPHSDLHDLPLACIEKGWPVFNRT